MRLEKRVLAALTPELTAHVAQWHDCSAAATEEHLHAFVHEVGEELRSITTKLNRATSEHDS